MENDWISTSQAAEISGYHPEWIRELVREGKLKARKWGQAYMISEQSLKEYLQIAMQQKDKRLGPKKSGSKS